MKVKLFQPFARSTLKKVPLKLKKLQIYFMFKNLSKRKTLLKSNNKQLTLALLSSSSATSLAIDAVSDIKIEYFKFVRV